MASTDATDTDATGKADSFDAVIIGAGFSGLYQLHCLRDRLGLKTRVLEAGDGVGGTWHWNRYPGARCDSESYYYSYSFSSELEQEWEWSERYPQHFEIKKYLEHVADRFDLRRDIAFEQRVVAARFDGASNRWEVRTEDGHRYTCEFLITAVGCLSTANMPQIAGLEHFTGQWYHTGKWPHAGVDFSGKRVALIGTGSTGIQATPVIAAEADHLTVFQRTPNYSVPARNGPMADDWKREIKADYAAIRARTKQSRNGFPYFLPDLKALDVDEAERRRLYEAAWEEGGLKFRSTFNDLLLSRAANDTAAEFIRDKIREIVKDPAVAERLTPRDHPFATKRPPIDSNYFETYNRDNVLLVDIRADPIESITATGVRLTSGAEHPVDIIVFATGFDAMTGPLLRLGITGRDGVDLKDVWAAGPYTYLGLQVAGFPNLFTITGPGSPSVLCNMPVAIEQHVEWITDCIRYMREKNLHRIEATDEAAAKWVQHVNDVANATLMPQAGHSWYLGANIPGKPRVFMPYAGGMAHYRGLCDEIVAKGYEGFALSS